MDDKKEDPYAWTSKFDIFPCPNCKKLKAELKESLKSVEQLIDHSNSLEKEYEELKINSVSLKERDRTIAQICAGYEEKLKEKEAIVQGAKLAFSVLDTDTEAANKAWKILEEVLYPNKGENE